MAVTRDHAEGANDNGFDTDLQASMLRAVIDRLQDKLRKKRIRLQEMERELEFLLKGGNPLDFQYQNGHLDIRSP